MLMILIGFLIIVVLQWFIIKRLPWRIIRVLIHLPLLTITVIATLFLLAVQQAQNEIETAQEVQAGILDSGTISRGDLIVSVSGTASIRPLRQVSLNFSLSSSPVTLINVQVGDTVTTGQILAELDNSDLVQALEDAELALEIERNNFEALTAPASPEDIAVAQAAVDSANAQVSSAVATGSSSEEREIARLETEIARNQLWQSQLNRDNIVENPPDDEHVPPEVAAQNQANYEGQTRDAEAGVEQAEFGVDIADAQNEATLGDYADPGQLASANAALVEAEVAYNQLVNGPSDLQLQQALADLGVAELLVEQAQLNLQESQIIAPFDGIVAEMNLTQGEIPAENVAIMLMDTSGFFVELPVDETDIAQITLGQTVLFEVDALPESEVTGIVSSIAYSPIPSEEANLVAYNVRIEVNANGARIRAGMTVTGNIITLERQDILLVRNNFIRIDRQTGDTYVTVRADGRLEERLILLDNRNDTYSEVTAGLAEGEEVVLLPREESTTGQ